VTGKFSFDELREFCRAAIVGKQAASSITLDGWLRTNQWPEEGKKGEGSDGDARGRSFRGEPRTESLPDAKGCQRRTQLLPV